MDQVDQDFAAFVAAHHREPIDTGELFAWLRVQQFERVHGRPPYSDAELMAYVRQYERSLLTRATGDDISFLN